MTDRIRLDAHINAQGANEALASVLTVLGQTCVDISRVVSGGALSGALGASGQINVQDEEQKKLDVITNDMLRETLAACPAVAGVASEELDTVEPTGRDGAGRFLVLFDPLDGSSNIDINGSVGTIFSILPAPAGTVDEAAFFQIGRHQAAAGYVLYGAQTMMVLTIKDGVHAFTLSADGQWLLTQGDIAIPADTREFAINMSNRRHWAEPVRRYVDALLDGKTGSRGKDFNMRWIAAMVGDVHRILMRGGVFLYPWDQREPNRAGKLRLMYEGNPMALLIERAGGKATTDGATPILDIQPTELHQRIPVVLGSANEVDQVATA